MDLDHEAPENPGTLVRRVDDGRFESYIHGRWEDHTPSLLWITMAPDSGDAVRLSDIEARRILRDLRAGLRT